MVDASLRGKAGTAGGPPRRCATCGRSFQQPWLNYGHFDCIKCVRASGVPLVTWHARPYAPKRYRLETIERHGLFKRPPGVPRKKKH